MKYGRGLNAEIEAAVLAGELPAVFTMADVREWTKRKNWEVPETYLRVCLANAAEGSTHSLTYKKRFIAHGNGEYSLIVRRGD